MCGFAKIVATTSWGKNYWKHSSVSKCFWINKTWKPENIHSSAGNTAVFSNFASSFAWLAPSEQNVISTRLVFTSDGVGVGVLSGVVRAFITLWKSKITVVSRVISATESESEESERFHFLPTPLTTPSKSHDLVKTGLMESEEEAEG